MLPRKKECCSNMLDALTPAHYFMVKFENSFQVTRCFSFPGGYEDLSDNRHLSQKLGISFNLIYHQITYFLIYKVISCNHVDGLR